MGAAGDPREPARRRATIGTQIAWHAAQTRLSGWGSWPASTARTASRPTVRPRRTWSSRPETPAMMTPWSRGSCARLRCLRRRPPFIHPADRCVVARGCRVCAVAIRNRANPTGQALSARANAAWGHRRMAQPIMIFDDDFATCRSVAVNRKDPQGWDTGRLASGAEISALRRNIFEAALSRPVKLSRARQQLRLLRRRGLDAAG